MHKDEGDAYFAISHQEIANLAAAQSLGVCAGVALLRASYEQIGFFCCRDADVVLEAGPGSSPIVLASCPGRRSM